MDRRIKNIFGSILVPGTKRSLLAMNVVRGVDVTDGRVKIELAGTGLDDGARSGIEEKLRQATSEMAGTENVAIEFVTAEPSELNHVKKTVAVMSGKGGVGKSTVTALLAIALRRMSMDVGIFDADITGPSIPHMFGVKQRPTASPSGIFAVPSASGISMMSMNLILKHDDDPVAWRGPAISGTIREFSKHVVWGNLNLLLVDLPPGTSDVQLTVIQSLSLSGSIIVFTPQALVEMVVRKSINLNRKMKVPILGLVENMSYLAVPELNKRVEPFGKSKADALAAAAGAALLATIPLSPDLSRLCDIGQIEQFDSEIIAELGSNLVKALKL